MSKFDAPWGYSKLAAYEECPAKFKYQFIQKMATKGSPAMERGSKIHDNLDAWMKGWDKDIPIEAENWRQALEVLKANPTTKAEQSWGISKDWRILPDWFHRDTWLRAKSDVHYMEDDKLVVIDYKTGKYKIPSTEQVELYAIAGSCVYPEAKVVVAEMWFIDTTELYSKEYTREHLIELRKKYEKRSQPMYTNEHWEPQPSRACRWCDFSKEKNGPCKY